MIGLTSTLLLRRENNRSSTLKRPAFKLNVPVQLVMTMMTVADREDSKGFVETARKMFTNFDDDDIGGGGGVRKNV